MMFAINRVYSNRRDIVIPYATPTTYRETYKEIPIGCESRAEAQGA
jgi:hypothetical protein